MTKQQVLNAAMALDHADRAEVADSLLALVPPAEWYERRQTGLGDAFKEAVRVAFRLIAAYPERRAIVEGSLRRYLMPRFKF